MYSKTNQNKFFNALYRDDGRSDAELSNILCTLVPSQIPENFEIVPLPNKIISWLTLLLQKLPVKKQLQEKHTSTKLGRGVDE